MRDEVSEHASVDKANVVVPKSHESTTSAADEATSTDTIISEVSDDNATVQADDAVTAK